MNLRIHTELYIYFEKYISGMFIAGVVLFRQQLSSGCSGTTVHWNHREESFEKISSNERNRLRESYGTRRT